MLFTPQALARTPIDVHAKYWDRWGDKTTAAVGAQHVPAGSGKFALEYEAAANGVEGAQYLYKESRGARPNAGD